MTLPALYERSVDSVSVLVTAPAPVLVAAPAPVPTRYR